ncbi:prephenate dehydrogenase [Parashewanella curva]|uniref:Prephenate dehydrogenase n=1 Tax=Parashewanella curva TaxID=2338552 RepID=A0A3L8PRW1_9GAMM|nr:prephenate dehydrogenase [Parashewanella curva]RLV58150.1 prephenate dehydrogenase [Parashewanella curva]
MSYQKVLEQIHQNLQLAYRKAIDLDSQLDGLKQEGKGKFSQIFNEDMGFVTKSNRFKPYVLELVEEFEELKQMPNLAESDITEIVARLGVVLQTQQAFKQQVK